jgi:uncharacterized protein
VIVPDLNLLIYAFNASARDHQAAARWWEALLNSQESVGVPWVVLLGFLRLLTGRHVVMEPYSPEDAIGLAAEWFERPNVQLLSATTRTRAILFDLVAHTGVAGGLLTDAAIAAAAIEHRATLHTNDTDFARFPDLRVRNPLVGG